MCPCLIGPGSRKLVQSDGEDLTEGLGNHPTRGLCGVKPETKWSFPAELTPTHTAQEYVPQHVLNPDSPGPRADRRPQCRDSPCGGGMWQEGPRVRVAASCQPLGSAGSEKPSVRTGSTDLWLLGKVVLVSGTRALLRSWPVRREQPHSPAASRQQGPVATGTQGHRPAPRPGPHSVERSQLGGPDPGTSASAAVCLQCCQVRASAAQ